MLRTERGEKKCCTGSNMASVSTQVSKKVNENMKSKQVSIIIITIIIITEIFRVP